MARKSPAFSFYPDSWVLGTMAMSYEEQGIYLRMLSFQWSNGPSDANAYANACGLAYFEHVKRILSSKFISIDGLYYNERLEEERRKQGERSGKAKDSAKRRWNKQDDANAMRTHQQNTCERISKTHANAMLEPMLEPMLSVSVSVSDSITGSESENMSASRGRSTYPDDFERFWNSFPRQRRTKKQEAFRKWKLAIKQVDAELLTKRAAEYAESEVGQGQFAVMPSVWLNGGCWEDSPEAWKSNSQSQGQQLLCKIANNMEAFVNG